MSARRVTAGFPWSGAPQPGVARRRATKIRGKIQIALLVPPPGSGAPAATEQCANGWIQVFHGAPGKHGGILNLRMQGDKALMGRMTRSSKRIVRSRNREFCNVLIDSRYRKVSFVSFPPNKLRMFPAVTFCLKFWDCSLLLLRLK